MYTRAMRALACAVVVALGAGAAPAETSATSAPVTTEQLLRLFFADQGRSVGYQSMLTVIQLESTRAQVERDAALLTRNQELFEKNVISELELEVSQLKDAWNRLQLRVVEKNLEGIAASVQALSQIGAHLQGDEVSVEALYQTYLTAWEAGCDKGPIEARANEAWAAYAAKALERAQELNARGSVPDSLVLQRAADLRIAEANYEKRAERLDRCRQVFFPSLEDILTVSK